MKLCYGILRVIIYIYALLAAYKKLLFTMLFTSILLLSFFVSYGMLLFPISSVFSLMRKIISYTSHMLMQSIVLYKYVLLQLCMLMVEINVRMIHSFRQFHLADMFPLYVSIANLHHK